MPGADDRDDDLNDNLRGRLLQGLAKRLQDPRKLSGDAMDVMSSILETSDRAKTEAVRLVAREVRSYLDELKLKEDLTRLLHSHSLEIKMSLSLKPLAEEPAPGAPAAPPPPARARADDGDPDV